ncbi:hypothetical protein LJB82_04005, partial [Desulfovibrio sp. OttesenSCG-928-M16]|nr:hypothetical protein [Desulfovibrio sp. OttesenSCG-928-M16]
MWKNRSIAFRLNMTLCPLIIFGVLFAIFINSEISYRTLEREIRERSMPALTNSIQSEIAIELSVAQRSLQYLSRWRTLTNWIKNGERQEELENIKDVCRTFVDVFKTGNINLTVDVTRNFYEAINNYPPTFKILDPVIDKWFDDIKDSNVKVRAHLHPVSDPVYGGQAFVNARVEDENGHFLGIVSTPFNLAGVQLLLKTKKIGQNGLTFIMHSDGLILLHPDPALVHKHITDLPGFEHLAWQDLSQKESSTRTTDHNGKALLIGSQPLDTMDGVIVTVADEAELFMDIDLARRYSLYAGLTVLLVTLGVSLRVSLIISRSFGSIINFANQVAAGL